MNVLGALLLKEMNQWGRWDGKERFFPDVEIRDGFIAGGHLYKLSDFSPIFVFLKFTPLIMSPSLGSALQSQGLRTGDNQGSISNCIRAHRTAQQHHRSYWTRE